MVRRFALAALIAGLCGAVAADDAPEFAPAELVLHKRLLVREAVAELTFLKKGRGLVAVSTPPELLQWSPHVAAGTVARWTLGSRTPITLRAESIRPLVSTNTSPVPEEELQRAVADERARREQVRVRYIFVPRAVGVSRRAAARQIEKFRRDIARGLSFETLAKQYSSHQSAPRGGDLGFTRRGALPPEVEAFAFSAAEGQTSPIFETTTGWHVVRVEERRQAATEAIVAEVERMWLEERLAFAENADRHVVAVAANARRIAVAAGHVLALYDLNDGDGALTPVYAFVEPATIDAVALTSGGNVVAIAGGGQLSIRRLKEGGLRQLISGVRSPHSLRFSPNAALLGVARERGIDIADLSERAVIASIRTPDELSAFAFSPDSRRLVTGDRAGRVQLWDAMTYERVRNGEPGYEARYWTDRTWLRIAEKRVDSEVRSFAFHPTAPLFVAGLASGKLVGFDVATGGRLPLGPAAPHDGPLVRSAFSDDGNILVTAAEDRTIAVWALPAEFKSGPRPRTRTLEELQMQHAEVVRVHAEFRTKREELERLQHEYDNQARYLREQLNSLIAQQSLPNWRAAERLPEGNALLRGIQGALGYRDELAAAVQALRLAMSDLENIARFQVMEIRARRVLQPEQFEQFATKIAQLSAQVPARQDPTVAPGRVPNFDRVWQYVLTGQ